MKPDVRLLTIAEVAARLNIPIGTMRWRRHLGHPPHPIKVGRNLRYPETEVDAYLDALCAGEEKLRNDKLVGRRRPARRTIGSSEEVGPDVGTTS